MIHASVEHAARDTKTRLSAAERESGDYPKGRVRWHTLTIAVEIPKGGTRRAHDNSWVVHDLPAHYGYIEGTKGADDEEFDVHVVSDKVKPVWIIDQHDTETGEFDEHKAVLGADSREHAADIYRRSFSDGKGDERNRHMRFMMPDEFARWVKKRGARREPIRELPGVMD